MMAQVIREAERRGQEIPPPWNDPPKVNEGLQIFMLCFNELTQERDYSPEYVPRIKKSAILQWAKDQGFNRDIEFMEDLVFLVRKLDDAWLPLEVDRRKKLQRKNKRGKPDAAEQHGEEAPRPSRQYSRSKQPA